MKSRIWLSSPHMGGTELKYIQEAFDQNWIAPLGPNVEGFEKDIESFVGNQTHVAAVSSGTAAIHLGLIMAGVTKDDEVLCQSFTFSASANPILYQGATPVFIDSEKDTWNMCPVALEEAIQDRLQKKKSVKAIIVVHLYGMPAKIKEIAAIAKKYEIALIEDAAEALGSHVDGQSCGTFGDYGVLSFNGNKIITTSGGGALVCQSKDEKQRAIFFATQARDDAPHYQHSHIGYNYRMSNIIAGVGRGQMEVLSNRVEARRKNQQMYVSIFKNTKGINVFSEPDATRYSNHWLSALTIDSEVCGFTREDIRLRLWEENIESRPLWKPMHLQPIFSKYPYYGHANVAEKLFAEGLCLPSGSNLTNDEKQRIQKVLSEFI